MREIISIVDLLASEYGWDIEYILSINIDVLNALFKAIEERKKTEYRVLAQIFGIATNLGLSGKLDKLEDLFKEKKEVSPDEMINQARNLWIKMGKDPAEFDRLVREGKEIKF